MVVEQGLESGEQWWIGARGDAELEPHRGDRWSEALERGVDRRAPAARCHCALDRVELLQMESIERGDQDVLAGGEVAEHPTLRHAGAGTDLPSGCLGEADVDDRAD